MERPPRPPRQDKDGAVQKDAKQGTGQSTTI